MKTVRTAIGMATVALYVAACGVIDDKPIVVDPGDPSPDPPSTSSAYDAYSNTLPQWSVFSPTEPAQDVAIEGSGESFNALVGNAIYTCTSERFTLTSNPTKIVTLNPDVAALWPGSLLQGRHYIDGVGSLAELPVRERAPIVLFVDKLADGGSRTVEAPTAATVQQAISEIILELQRQGTPVSSDLYFTMKQAYSAEQSALHLGMSARYAGAAMSGAFSRERNFDETRVTAHFVQQLFTIGVVSPQTPGQMFSGAFTQEKLDEQVALGRIGPDNVPVYVAGVTYGRILHFTLTSKASEETITRILNASYSALGQGGSANLTAQDRRVLEEATIEVIAVGGDADAALAVIRSGDLREYFAANAPLSSARPISYEVHNLGDDANAVFSETTTYNLQNCGKPQEREMRATLSGSAKTSDNILRCYGCRNWWRAADRRTLPAGSYFVQDHDVVALPGGNPSQHACTVTRYDDFFTIPLADGKSTRVPRTVHYAAEMYSPHGAGRTGSLSCDYTFRYLTYR